MNKEKLKADIVTWLYLNDGAFKSNLEWRAEFLDHLDNLLKFDFDDPSQDVITWKEKVRVLGDRAVEPFPICKDK